MFPVSKADESKVITIPKLRTYIRDQGLCTHLNMLFTNRYSLCFDISEWTLNFSF